MLSQSVLIEQIKKRCFEKDKINGDIKFRFILNIFKNLNILESSEIEKLVINSDLFSNGNFISLSNIIPRYTNEYKEYNKIGQGGFGEVFVSKHYLDNNLYAVKKIIIPEEKHSDINSAISEILILSRLNHPNIVRYFNSWIEPCIIETNKIESLDGKSNYSSYSFENISNDEENKMITFDNLDNDEK